MQIRLLILPLLICLGNRSYAQTAKMIVSVADMPRNQPEKYVFRVTIVTDSANIYWLQDTSYLQKFVEDPSLLVPRLKKRVGNEYVRYEKFKHFPGYLPDKCVDSCCNCISLGKSQSVSFYINLLKCFVITPGDYILDVDLSPPLYSYTNLNIDLRNLEIESNKVYFTVR
jgi:hypothetical protein